MSGTELSEHRERTVRRTKSQLDYFRVLILPGFVVSVFLSYGPPPGRVLDSLSRRSDRVRDIGPLSLHAADVLVRIPRTGATNLLVNHPQRGVRKFGLPSEAELNGLRELERKDLIAFDHPMDAFLTRLRAAGRLLERDPRSHSWDRVWIELPGATTELGQSLERETYRLTAAGRKAAEAISGAASTRLASSD